MWKQLAFLLVLIWVGGCRNPNTNIPTFEEYYQKNFTTLNSELDTAVLRDTTIESVYFTIDSVQRSMKGPLQNLDFVLGKANDLLWITGYEIDVVDSLGNSFGGEFMCHNNLNIASVEAFKWQAHHWSVNPRIFTQTQGIQQSELPQGFGIPIPGNTQLRIMFQSLNHNQYPVSLRLKHKARISYYLQSELSSKMKALQHRTVWVMKQFKGPVGLPNSDTNSQSAATNEVPTCGIESLANDQHQSFDIFWDDYGRKYTGHWKLPPGKEVVEFNVSHQLNLHKDCKAYYFTAHVHPYCDSLQLFDATTKKYVWKANMVQKNSGIGISLIPSYSVEGGIELKKDHQYVLKSYYNNTALDTLSAMSAMYLFTD